MRNLATKLFFLLTVLGVTSLALAESSHVNSLNEVSQIKLSKEAARNRADQLGGIDAPDKFTNNVPTGYDKAAVLKCVGAVPAMVQDKDLLYGITPRGDANVVLLGWHAYEIDGEVAGYVLGILKGNECLAKSKIIRLNDEEVNHFDRANFKLTPTESAIAIRTIHNEGYAGGGASAETLRAYRVIGKDIFEIFASPIHFDSDIAGDWHNDGTRGHDITDVTAVLNVESSETQGIFDWRKSVKKRKSQIFRWNGVRYETKDPEPIREVKEQFDR